MGRKLFSLLRTMVICYVVSLLLLSLAAVLLWKMQLSVQQMQIGVYAIYGLSCLAGGFLCGKILTDRRVLWGLLFGLAYFVLLALLSVILSHAMIAISGRVILSLVMCLLGGFLGALIS